MGFEFVKADARYVPGRASPQISISRVGKLGILRGCFVEFPALNSWTHVRLGYDRETYQLAICKSQPQDIGAQKIARAATSATVSVASTCSRFGIPCYGTLRRFTDVTYDAEKEMLIVDLRELMADDKATKG